MEMIVPELDFCAAIHTNAQAKMTPSQANRNFIASFRSYKFDFEERGADLTMRLHRMGHDDGLSLREMLGR
jgi:hypothetical protein